jgi:hypothetical protein
MTAAIDLKFVRGRIAITRSSPEQPTEWGGREGNCLHEVLFIARVLVA